MVFLSAGMLFASGGKEAEGATGSEQTSDTTQKYKEAPMLAEMVAKGELPPVDQRLPEEPLVITPIENRHAGELVPNRQRQHQYRNEYRS